MRTRRVAAIAAAAAGTLLHPCLAFAQVTYQYQGGGTTAAPTSGAFSGTNFMPTLGTPAAPVSTNIDTLAFGGTTAYTATDDITATLNARTLSFTNSGAVSLLQGAGTTISLSNATSDAINFNNTGSLLIALNLVLGGPTTITGSGNATISGAISGNRQFTMNGTGTLTLTGANTFSTVFAKTGTLVLSGAATTSSAFSSIGQTSGDNGTLSLTGAASFNATGTVQDLNISDLVGSTGTINMNSTGTFATANSFIGKGSTATTNAGGTGTLNISSGTFNTTILHLGSFGTSTGAINQTGGTVAITSTAAESRIGGYNGAGDVNAYGIWNLSGGVATSVASTQFGGYGTGYLNQTGGAINFTAGYVDAGRFAGSYGVIDVSGGTLTQTATGTRLFAGENGFGVITVRGTGTVTSNGGIIVGNGGTGAGGILNIDGGILNAAFINTSATASTAGTLVDFNGGTLRPTAASTNFLTGIGAAYVYSGGAIFDTNSFNATIAQPLLAPTGSGVSAVTITNPGTGYVNAPVVKISGGGGTGATAIATVSGGVITGITITNPGIGYTSQPTFTLVGGQANGTGAAFTATLTANTSGGLTKNGAGMLTLTGTNTYTGGSTVNAGVLQYAAQGNVGTGKVTVNSGGTAADSAAINQAFLTTINSSSAGVVALGASSANNLDFSATGLNAPNLSLGAIGAFTYSGTLTPFGTTYLLGGGGGALTVSSALTGANSLIVGVNGTSAASSIILTGANTYSGGTTLNGGILSIGADSFLGVVPAAPTTNLTFNGGTLAATASFSLDPNRSVTIGTGGATTQVGANTLTIPGVITSTGTGTVLKTTNGDTGALVLSGNNSFAAGSIIQITGGSTGTSGGILRLANSNALGTNAITINDTLGMNASLSMVQLSGGITIPSTVTLNLAGHNAGNTNDDHLRNFSGNNTFNGVISIATTGGGYYFDSAAGAGTLLTLGGTIQNNYTAAASTRGPIFYGNGNTTATGSITNGSATGLTSVGAGDATHVNTGIVTISGNNSYTGGTTAFSGTLRLGSVTAIPTGTALTVGALGIFDLNGQYQTAMGTTGAGLSLTTLGLTSGGTLNFNVGGSASDQLTFTGGVVSTGGKISVGALSGASTLTTGNYTLITDAVGNSSSFTLSNTNVVIGAFAYPLSLTSTTGSVVLTVGSGVLGTAYWTGSQSNVWNTGGGGTASNFSTDAAGANNTLALPNPATDVYFTATNATNFASTLGQDFTINSLTMGLGASATNATTIGGANTLTIAASGGAYAGGVGITVPAANTAAQTISANVALGASQSWTNNSTGLFTVSGNVSGAFALTTAGAGTTLLSGVNTYSGGTTVGGGVLRLGSATALGATTASTMVSGGTLNLNGQNVTQNNLVLSGGTVSDTTGTGSLTLTSATGAIAIPTTINYAAATAAVTGNIVLTGSGGAIAKGSGLGNPVFTGGLTLGSGNYNVALADTAGDPAAELSLTGVVSGAGSLTLANNAAVTGVTFANQADYGTLLLSGANTYTGGTNINFGRIVITNGSALGTGAVTLAQSATPTTGGTLQLGNTGYTAASSPLASGTIALGITVPNAINLGGPTSGDYGSGISNNNGANTLSGAITLTNASQIVNVAGGSLTITGNIGQTTTAALTKNGANTLTLAPTSGTANTYSGGTLIPAGELLFASDGYLGTGAVTLSGGYLGYTGGTETFSLPFAAANAGGGGFDVVNAATNFTIPNYASTGTLQKIGLGTLTLGTTTTATNTLFHAGTVVIPTGATLTNTSYTSVGTNSGDNSTLTANGTYTVPNDFNVADNSGANGILNINNGAVIKGTTTYIGKNGGATGVVNQTGGSYQQTGTGDFVIGGIAGGAAAVGTYNLLGGTLTDGSNFQVGVYGTGSLNISGTGAATNTAGFTSIGRNAGAFGVLDVSGGSYTYSGGNRIIVGEQGTGVLNIRGTGTVSTTNTASVVEFGGGETTGLTGVGIINLDGGTLATSGIITNTSSNSSTLNFNGGTLQSNASSTTFVAGVNNAYVYSGGANINTNGFNDTISQVLQTPTGNGLSAVSVTNGGAGYQTTPVVQITGGGGTGATAVATINASGVITGITITNPGVGYTSAPTVTVISGSNAGYAPVGGATFSTAIAANTSGGLNKTGTGALTLTGANTFSGGVIVNAGSVIAGGTSVGTGGVIVASGATLGVGEALNNTNSAITPTSLSASTLAVTLGSSTPLLTFNLGASGTNDVLNLTSTSATDLTYSGAGVFDIGFASATGNSLGAGMYTLVNFANPEAFSSAPDIGAYQAVPQGNLAAINGGSFAYQTNGSGNIVALLFSIGGSADALPEPGSIALTLLGLGGPLALIARRRKKA